MANTFIPKRSTVVGKVPLPADLQIGELAINLADRKIYTKDANSAVVQLNDAAGVGSFNSRTGAVTLTSSDVTTALGYTPLNKAGDTASGQISATTFRAAVGVPTNGNQSTTGFAFGADGDSGLFSAADGDTRIYNNAGLKAQFASTNRFYSGSWGDWNNVTMVVQADGQDNVGISFHCPQRSTAAIFKMYGPTNAFECRNAGDTAFVNIQAANFVVSSDYRLKEKVQPMAGGLDRIKALRPCTFTWKESGEAAEGFIAHELQEVAPMAVFGQKDAAMDDGSPLYQGVDLSKLVPILTAAIQELSANLSAAEARIAALESTRG